MRITRKSGAVVGLLLLLAVAGVFAFSVPVNSISYTKTTEPFCIDMLGSSPSYIAKTQYAPGAHFHILLGQLDDYRKARQSLLHDDGYAFSEYYCGSGGKDVQYKLYL